jgi:hypothetical protein
MAGFVEEFQEYRDLGYQDWEIAKRMGISLRALVRQLYRHKLPVAEFTSQMAKEERR